MPGIGIGLGLGLGGGSGGGGGVSLPTLAFAAAVAQAEGASGTTVFTFTLNLTRNGSTASITVAWAVTGSGANPATASDFAGGVLPSGSVTFAAGETSKTIVVNVAGDSTVEPDEGFTVTAIGSLPLASAAIGGTILNDDTAPAYTFLPTLAGTLKLGWSLYKLRSAYTGPVAWLTRASDGTTLDIYPVSGGQAPDLSAVAAFVSGTTATLLRYDQSGNGYHETVPSGGYAALWLSGNAQYGFYSASFPNPAQAWTRFPDGLATNRQDVCMAHVMGIVGGNGQVTSVGNVNDGSSNFSLAMYGAKPALIGTGLNTLDLALPADMGVVIANSRSSGSAIRVNSRRATIGTQVAIATLGGSLGRYGNLTSLTPPGAREDFATIVYPGLSDTDEASLQAALAAIFSVPSMTDQMVVPGDSLSIGYLSASGRSPTRLFAANASRRISVSNLGVPGQSQQNITANNALYAAQYDATSFSGKHILVNNAGTNDIYNGRTADQIYGDLTSFFSAQKAAGWDVVQTTILKQSVFGSGSGETIRQDVNNRLVTNAATLGITVVDIAADSRLSNPANGTYFNGDGTHLTDAGYAVVESLIRGPINARLAL